MMILHQILMVICAFSFGIICSAGVFTVLVAVGLIPRFAGKLNIAKHIMFLEEMVVFGTITGGVISIFPKFFELGDAVYKNQLFGAATHEIWPLAGMAVGIIYGVFSGMFVGCLALAIAEMLDSIPIFARRAGFREGIGIVIIAFACGKLTGSLIYFSQGMFLL
ncbi:MAG: stage V sporulation protein AB [Lachnospiraceae bacterium]|nr:stage V sporulation protein AB [Lachnospiraceae bacterium]